MVRDLFEVWSYLGRKVFEAIELSRVQSTQGYVWVVMGTNEIHSLT